MGEGEGVGEGEEVADERVGEAGLAGGDGLGQTGEVSALREALQLPVAGGPLPSLGPLHQTDTGAAVAALGSPPPARPPAARSPGRRAPPAGTRWSRGGGLGRRSRRPPCTAPKDPGSGIRGRRCSELSTDFEYHSISFHC